MSSETEILYALRNMMITLAITPITSCDAIAIGDTTATVADPSQLSAGQLFALYDDLELPVPIASDWDGNNPIAFNWEAAAQNAFTHNHVAALPCGTGLFTEAISDPANMIVGDNLFIQIVSTGWRDTLISGHLSCPTYNIHLEIRRALIQPRNSGPTPGKQFNANVWSIAQQQHCKEDMALIKRALLDNPTLADNNGEHAIFLGDAQNPNADLLQVSWMKLLIDVNTTHFAGNVDFQVRGKEEVFTNDPGLRAAYAA